MALKTACVQLNAGPVIDDNLQAAAELIREAAGQGAQFIATPENTCHMRSPQSEKLKSAKPEDTHPGIPFFSELARELGVFLLAGSLSPVLPSMASPVKQQAACGTKPAA